jgi:hypothetical protein
MGWASGLIRWKILRYHIVHHNKKGLSMLELILSTFVLLLIVQYCMWPLAVLADLFATRNDAYAFLIPFYWIPKVINQFIASWKNLY